jgi:hypothetical protein
MKDTVGVVPVRKTWEYDYLGKNYPFFIDLTKKKEV